MRKEIKESKEKKGIRGTKRGRNGGEGEEKGGWEICMGGLVNRVLYIFWFKIGNGRGKERTTKEKYRWPSWKETEGRREKRSEEELNESNGKERK